MLATEEPGEKSSPLASRARYMYLAEN